MLEKVSVILVNESGKKLFIDEEFKKKVSSKTIFLGSEKEGRDVAKIENATTTSRIDEVGSGAFIPKPNNQLPSEKPERKYKKKYPEKKLGRPRKTKYKEVYNPDIDEMKTGIE